MINCPKCGFEQPPDKYCAQCGVNMEVFRAPRPPLTRRLAGSGAFLGFLLGVVVFSTVYFIYHHQKSEIESFAAKVMQSPPSVSATPTASSEEQLQASEDQSDDSVNVAANDDVTKLETTQNAVMQVVTTSTLMPSAAESVNAYTSSQKAPRRLPLSVIFLEVPQSALPVIFAGLSEAGQSGVIPDFATRMNQIKTSKTADSVRVLKEEKLSLESGQAKLTHTLQNGQGRALSIAASSRGGGTEPLSLEIMIENKGMMSGTFGSELSVQNFQGNFEIPSRSAAYFADVMSKPTGLPGELESELSKDPIFRVLNSPNFTQRQSSFFIFFENSEESSTGSP